MTYFYARDVLLTLAPERLACWAALAPTNGPYRLTRTGPRSFELEEIAPPRNDSYGTFLAAKRPFAIGDHVEQCGATIHVEAVRFGTPRVVRVETVDPLDSAAIELLGMKDYRLRRVRLPPIGGSVELPRLDGAR